jgi:hypothetical protein
MTDTVLAFLAAGGTSGRADATWLLAIVLALFVLACVLLSVTHGLVDLGLWVHRRVECARSNAAARRARKHRALRGQKRPYLDERTEAWHV